MVHEEDIAGASLAFAPPSALRQRFYENQPSIVSTFFVHKFTCGVICGDLNFEKVIDALKQWGLWRR